MHWLNGAFQSLYLSSFLLRRASKCTRNYLCKIKYRSHSNSLIQLQALANLIIGFNCCQTMFGNTRAYFSPQNQPQLAHQEKLLKTLPDCHPIMYRIKSRASVCVGSHWLWWTTHPLGGWLNPKRCVETLLNHPLIQVQTYHRITAVESTVSGPKLQITISSNQHTSIVRSADLGKCTRGQPIYSNTITLQSSSRSDHRN